jgi:hypothetical protein
VRAFAADPDAKVRVVAPALNSRLRHWFSDSDGALSDALASFPATDHTHEIRLETA